jgi:hypothetical protein
MQSKPAAVLVALVMVGVLSASTKPPTDKAGPDEIGSSEWFKAMRIADGNSAMLKALPGSNGQPVVPPDCVEISAVLNVAATNPYFKGRLPHLRIVSSDDRVDNVPRSPYIYQTPGQAPHFYTVLKRDLTYEFYWLDGMREERIGTWKVPAGAGNQLRLIFAIDARGGGKIALAGGENRRKR